MKKKLLPFILGCAMVAAMPLAAHATPDVEYANEISTGTTPQSGDESLNGFTEYNDVTTTENTTAKVFGSGAGSIGNTRNTTSTMQTSYPVALMNEQQDYRSDPTDASTLAEDLAEAASADPDDNDFNEQTNDTAGTTDLETAVPEFTMTIPASTVLPLGATYWRIGNVEINGKYFVRPDKVDVVTTHSDFRHPDYDGTQGDTHKLAHSIAFTVADKRYDDTSIEGLDRYYFQNGSNKQTVFPKAYQAYSSTGYENGLVSEINETHQVWVKAATWSGKTPGKYTGSITFTASVVTDDTGMYQDKYPAEGAETDPNAAP